MPRGAPTITMSIRLTPAQRTLVAKWAAVDNKPVSVWVAGIAVRNAELREARGA